MSVLGALAAQLVTGGYGQIGVNIWAPTIDSTTTYPAYGLTRYEGLTVDTFSRSDEQPRVQLMVKSAEQDYQEAEVLIEAARLYLDGLHDFTADGTTIAYVRSTSGIMYLGQDTDSRHQFSTNLEVTRWENQ